MSEENTPTNGGNEGAQPSAPSIEGANAPDTAVVSVPASGGISEGEPDSGFDTEVFEFDGVGTDGEYTPDARTYDPGATPVAPPPVQGQPTEAPAQAAPEAQPQAPAQPQVQQAPPVPPQQGEVPQGQAPMTEAQAPQPPLSPGDVAQSLMANPAQGVQFLAENLYQLTPDEVAALEDNGMEAVPSLLGKVHLNVMVATLQRMQEYVPIMVQQQVERREASRAAVDAFYSTHESLDRNNPQHVDTLRRLGPAYRQANPQASREQFIKDVGAAACAALGLVPGKRGAAPVAQPQVYGQPNPVPQAYQPIANGRGMPGAPALPGEFDILGQDFDN